MIWTQPEIINWSQLLLDSYSKFLGHQLIERTSEVEQQAKELFFASFVVVSHQTEEDPILNYGNQIALDLWETDWENFTRTPSRLTAEPVNRQERQQMLMQAATQGFIDNYRGVRISSKGKRFFIEKAIIWNVVDVKGSVCGQAATFSEWSIWQN
ncbi:MAG: MEKHLA domain-containing protein [Prochloraceae cyanobacterium]|nr:MEKHLA domain-containing protein [Prochloraceae cyanobacterium]